MMAMKIKEAFKKFLDISGTALLFMLAVFLSFELYSIYIQSLLYLPVLISLLAVFGILSYFKYNKKLRAGYFVIAYFVFISLLVFASIFFRQAFFITLIVFDLTIAPFILLIKKEMHENSFKFIKKLFGYIVFSFEASSIILVLSIFLPVPTAFLPNITANVYYSSSTSILNKPLNNPNILNFFYFFNTTNQTEIEGIANVIKVDNISYNNSFRAYCLNAQTTKYWIQDCISYQPYYNIFSREQNYELATEIWQGQKSLLNVAEIIPNASIYKNQTFYLKLVVKNNTEFAYETNNGRIEYIKVELPENQSFGIITDNSSMNTEIHEDSYFAINTGPLGYYALNTTLTSLSGNFKYEQPALVGFPYLYGTGNFSFKASCFDYCSMNYTGANDIIYKVNALSNNSVMTTTYYYPMNALKWKDVQSLENGNCMIFNWGLMYGIPPVLIENWSKNPNTNLTNLTICNSNETFGEYLKSINKTI